MAQEQLAAKATSIVSTALHSAVSHFEDNIPEPQLLKLCQPALQRRVCAECRPTGLQSNCLSLPGRKGGHSEKLVSYNRLFPSMTVLLSRAMRPAECCPWKHAHLLESVYERAICLKLQSEARDYMSRDRGKSKKCNLALLGHFHYGRWRRGYWGISRALHNSHSTHIGDIHCAAVLS